ncbi:MAG: diaminopimelate decarboxylase [Actinomycetota bacterium]|jgi:diaminopimelate decarboxylase|nr:diaminopimelate decarboxylase [Actinomycetota bacterium]
MTSDLGRRSTKDSRVTADPRASGPQEVTAPADGPLARHLLPDTAEVAENGHLRVGGVDLVDLAEEVGTPLFVYDEVHLRARCREAVSAWGDGVAYATKAFLCKAIARLAHEEGMWLDVSTFGELQVTLAAGVPPARIVVHGNNKSEEELDAALCAGVGRIVVDSFDEIARLGKLTDAPRGTGRSKGHQDRAGRPKVLVRVTPGVEVHTHEFVRTGQEDTKFGFSVASGAASKAVAALELLPGVELVGVHAHIGSQVFDVAHFEEAARVLGEFAAPLDLPELVVGGGLGVAYLNAETAPTQEQWAQAARHACLRAGVDPRTRITAEPGRSIVASAAITLYTVGTIKDLPGIRTYVAVDGGMSDNPRPVLYGSGYEAFLPRAAGAARPRVVRIVGKHCETGDVLVDAAHVPADLTVGDVLATPVTGAYGYSMASNYNKVPRPPIVFVRDGRAKVVVRRETVDDLLRLETT